MYKGKANHPSRRLFLCRIEGSNDYIIVKGPVLSMPDSFLVFSTGGGWSPNHLTGKASTAKEIVKSDRQSGRGFSWEAQLQTQFFAYGMSDELTLQTSRKSYYSVGD